MTEIQRITIEQQLAEVGVRSTPAQMHIARPRMNMKITTESPTMEIDRQNPSFRINRKKINNESGLKGPMELAKTYRDQGTSTAMKSTKEKGKEGDFIGDLTKPGNRIAQIAHSKAMASATRKKQANIGLMPKHSPEVVWDTGSMSINWSKHSIVIDWDGEYMPQVTIDPKYSIEVFLRTEPYFRILVEDIPSALTPGRYIDREI